MRKIVGLSAGVVVMLIAAIALGMFFKSSGSSDPLFVAGDAKASVLVFRSGVSADNGYNWACYTQTQQVESPAACLLQFNNNNVQCYVVPFPSINADLATEENLYTAAAKAIWGYELTNPQLNVLKVTSPDLTKFTALSSPPQDIQQGKPKPGYFATLQPLTSAGFVTDTGARVGAAGAFWASKDVLNYWLEAGATRTDHGTLGLVWQCTNSDYTKFNIADRDALALQMRTWVHDNVVLERVTDVSLNGKFAPGQVG